MASERESKIREVTCPRCDTDNLVRIGMFGVQTVFCQGCGMEIKLFHDRTLVGLELKRDKHKSQARSEGQP